ncbi:hypothetical protein ACFOZ0_22990 [Streptomyces yaanensis]|uniref:Holin-X, holin superfamily III n=1 Tax=Streptomyces yaanensis TaxID=1142239 RepID=A0ABV7SHE8_9ACTN|nr:hypothetical protein [Streptomyces sp. CGMCC 4.7035]WNC01088.1 hypothetical protein Q2K21_25205 [Streptomyces sp. CGMCC 4.7035]
MAVFGFLEWCRQLRAVRFAAAGEPPRTAGPDEDGAAGLDDCALKAYAMQRREWAEALIEVENARVEGEIRLLAVRLLLGTACGSVLLFSIAVSARMAPSLGLDALTPLTTTVLGALGAAVVTALAASVGRALRGRTGAARAPEVSGSPSPADEQPPPPGPGRADAP